jgi:hypothetical protein
MLILNVGSSHLAFHEKFNERNFCFPFCLEIRKTPRIKTDKGRTSKRLGNADTKMFCSVTNLPYELNNEKNQSKDKSSLDESLDKRRKEREA